MEAVTAHQIVFGEGIHYCLGASLARIEGAIAIGTTLARFPGLGLLNPDEQFSYKGSDFLRGLSSCQWRSVNRLSSTA